MSKKRQAPKKRYYTRHRSTWIDMSAVNGITEQCLTARKVLPIHVRLLSALWRR